MEGYGENRRTRRMKFSRWVRIKRNAWRMICRYSGRTCLMVVYVLFSIMLTGAVLAAWTVLRAL